MQQFNKIPYKPLEFYGELIQRVIADQSLIKGVAVSDFEIAWANFCQANYCVSLGNGFDALRMALLALGIKQGDAVLYSSMTCLPTMQAITSMGAFPIPLEIDPATRLIDPYRIEEQITKKTTAIIIVHLYGTIFPTDVIKDLVRSYDLAIIEDCAQAHGGRYPDGEPVGSYADVACWSFYPTKNLGCLGDGGAITTNWGELAKKVRHLANYGKVHEEHALDTGFNSRLDTIQAAVLLSHLPDLVERNQRRREIARLYTQALQEINANFNPDIDLLGLPCDNPGDVYHQYVITTELRDALCSFLQMNGIETMIHYPHTPHAMYYGKSFANMLSDTFFRRCLSLPIYPEMTDANVFTVTEKILEWSNLL